MGGYCSSEMQRIPILVWYWPSIGVLVNPWIILGWILFLFSWKLDIVHKMHIPWIIHQLWEKGEQKESRLAFKFLGMFDRLPDQINFWPSCLVNQPHHTKKYRTNKTETCQMKTHLSQWNQTWKWGIVNKNFDHTKTRITTLYFQDLVGLVLLTSEMQWRP